MGASDLISNGKDVAIIENHKTDDFSNVYSNARNSYYNVVGTPSAFFDGILPVYGGSGTQSMYPSYLPKYNERINILSDFYMDIVGLTEDFQSGEVVININNVAGSYGNLKLHVAITESDIPYSWQGLNELNNVNRLMVPDQNGTDLNFSSQGDYQLALPFNMNSSWVFENCEVVAFLQDYATKEIYQAVKLSMNDFNTQVIANFTVNDQELFSGESAVFTDFSTGSITNWEWEFEGGTPASYSGQNPPAIVYNTVGLFDVMLTVSNTMSSDVETKTDYIQVINPVLSIDISVFCEGPFDGGDMMYTTLNGLVPLGQPYNQPPWNYNGTESVDPMPNNIVDWVIVELRDAPSAAFATDDKLIARQSALLRNDGKIVALDGISAVDFEVSYMDGLFVVIHHRNHLSIMSASALSESSGLYPWDFTDNENKAYGGVAAQNEVNPGIWGMIGGDGNADGTIDINDIDPIWETMAGWRGYLMGDINLDGEVNNIDKNDYGVINNLKSTQVP